MFTGLIQSRGIVRRTENITDGRRIEIDLGELPLKSIRLGDSIAVSGVCLTVVHLNDSVASFDVSSETLKRSLINSWQDGKVVNLETALTLQTPLGGHLVSGHVDGLAMLVDCQPTGDMVAMTFSADRQLGKYIALKGSVCLDGVSLTSNTVTDSQDGTSFTIMVVPHTLRSTSLSTLKQGDQLHLEVDLVARYLYRLMQAEKVDQNFQNVNE